jgi:hypothetical protein
MVYTKPLPPTITVMSKSFDLMAYLREVCTVIKDNLAADSERHLMDQEFATNGLDDALDEVATSIDRVEQLWECDPTPDTLWGDSGGEPPVTQAERHAAAHQEHLEAHR